MDDMLTQSEKDEIGKIVAGTLSNFAVGAIVGCVTAKIMSMLATNIYKHEIQGNTVLAPKSDKTVLSDNETTATDVDSSLSSDEVAAKNGSLNAAETEAAALNSEATASESGATAVRAKAGASDIETKALKMT